MPTLQSFFAQRKRWASKSLVYDDKRIIAVLFLVLVVNLLFPIMLVTSFWNPYYLLYALLYALIKALIEWRFVSDVADFYGSRRLMSRFLLFQPLHMLYTVFAGMAGQLGGYEWKGRKTK